MESKKQTAVEWVLEYLWKNHHLSFSDSNLMKAKAMEKEQIESAYKAGYNDCAWDRSSDCEHYYTSTYGQ